MIIGDAHVGAVRSPHFIQMIPGLLIVPDFVTLDMESRVDRWLGPASNRDVDSDRNRVLRFGTGVHAAGYSSGVVTISVPPVLSELADLMVARGLIKTKATSISVNEYLPGQSIHWHTDKPIAGESIVVLGLLCATVMGMRKGKTEIDIPFPARAVMQMTGESRYDWQHRTYPSEGRRVSIVFRAPDLV